MRPRQHLHSSSCRWKQSLVIVQFGDHRQSADPRLVHNAQTLREDHAPECTSWDQTHQDSGSDEGCPEHTATIDTPYFTVEYLDITTASYSSRKLETKPTNRHTLHMFILHVHNVTVHIIGLMKHHASNNFNDDRKLLRPDQPPKMTILQIQICISFGQKYIDCQCRHSVSF